MSRFDSHAAREAFDRALVSPVLGDPDYTRAWIKDLRLVSVPEPGLFRVTVPDALTRNFIVERFEPLLIATLEAEFGIPVTFDWSIDTPPPPVEPGAAVSAESPAPAPRAFETNRLDPRHTFETFVLASSNQLAYNGAHTVARNPTSPYNPIFIYGDSGLGKTHLLQAIGNHLLKMNPSMKVVYRTAEEFTNEFIHALGRHAMPEFRRRYRENCDCLLIDDIQFIANKKETQEEFFYTFNSLHGLHRPIALTADTIPAELNGIADRLKTRFASGLTADIIEPDFETRVAILIAKAEELGMTLSLPVAHFVAEKVPRNGRELKGALMRIFAASNLIGPELTVDIAEKALKSILPAPRPVDIDRIQREACRLYKISQDQLVGPTKPKNIAHARQVAMWVCRKKTTASFPDIGKAFNRNHSTVIDACDKIDLKQKSDPKLHQELQDFLARLNR